MTLTTGIERLRIRNYRVLRDVELDGLTPVTALLGPNGSGKSTMFDALDFLSESLRVGLRSAWDRRGGTSDIVTHGATGPVEIELTCRIEGAVGAYRLAIEYDDDEPVVAEEKLTWQPEGAETPFDALHFRRGDGGFANAGAWELLELAAPDLLGLGVVSQLAGKVEVGRFRRFIGQIVLADLNLDAMRKGSRESRTVWLRPNGENLGSVVRLFSLELPQEWENIRASLRKYVPGLEDIESFQQGDGSWIVRLREQGKEELVGPENISDGTLLLLGYLLALRTYASVLLIEEPENQVHPRLHYSLAEDARGARADQVIVATHAPRFVDALRPDEVWTFARGNDGNAQAKRASDEAPIVRMVESGGALGDLWTEGYFRFGDPLGERP
ncbi:AAA family ATPase [Amycolatopsis sp. A133]|uniref:AAA family ATPase n=1 Tax=Amycolatopsis sp. A133 TaxID=3064472 RepID=UPI0027F8AD35|nr:AAA family ATPase [Amycolatopsis sp. A133]MDQ7803275.1 AAA family ATPase [Amycolatopsis sp. A133]